MKSAEIEKSLVSLEQQHETERQRLDAKIVGVRPELQTEAAKWINGEVETQVVEHAVVVNSHGVERLREFKTRVKALIASLPEIVANETSTREEWPHNAAPLGQVRSALGESYFSAVFRRIVSHLGPILDEYKLLTDYHTWSKSGNRVEYRIHTGFDAQSIPGILDYHQDYRTFQAVESEVLKLRKALTEARAKELWESA